MVAVLIAILVLLILINGVASVDVAAFRAEEQEEIALQEKWTARGGASLVSGFLQTKIPQYYDADTAQARLWAGRTELPAFDEISVSAQNSRPIAQVNRDTGQLERTDYTADTATSLLGHGGLRESGSWALARAGHFREYADEQGYGPEAVNIFSIRETERRSSGLAEPAYVLTYIIDAKAGYARYRHSRQLLLGPNPGNCDTTVSLTVTPPVVAAGQSVVLRATYTGANLLRFYDSFGALLHEETVTEDLNPNTFSFSVTPSSTTSYYVEAFGPGTCFSRTSPETVTVTPLPPPSCPRIADFSASSLLVNAGETVTLSWNVTDAFEVRLEGNLVASSGSQTVTVNADQTFILTARDAANTCPVNQTVTVRVRVGPPPCGLATPDIRNFTATPASIRMGETSQLRWQVGDLAPSGEVRVLGPNGFTQAGLLGDGQLDVTPPLAEGDYSYTLEAVNVCPDGSRLSSSSVRIVRVRACPPPTIDVFTATPGSVIQGLGGVVRLEWSISGTADLVGIDNGVGGGLPASGFVDVPAPVADTTYTLTAVGCGQTRTASVLVRVISPPVGCSSFVDPLPANLTPLLTDPLILGFGSNTGFVFGDGQILLQWETRNADQATLNGAAVPTTTYAGGVLISGYPVSPAARTTYTLQVWSSSDPSRRETRSIDVEPDNTPLSFAGLYLNVTNPSGGKKQTDNFAPGEQVTISYDSFNWSGDNTGLTVEIPGLASNLPRTGTFSFSAPDRTTEYSIVARQAGNTFIIPYTVIVENPADMGPGYVVYGVIPSNFAGTLGVRVLLNRLSNGSLRVMLVGDQGTGPIGGGLSLGVGQSVPAGLFTQLAQPRLTLYQSGILVTNATYVGSGVSGTFGAEFIVPASSLPTQSCPPRYDFVLSATRLEGSFGILTPSPSIFVADTRNNSVSPHPFIANPLIPVVAWTQNDWEQKRIVW